MHIQVIKVSKPAIDVSELVKTYLTRLKPFVSIKLVQCKEAELAKKTEVLKKPSDFLVILDERGKLWTSKELAGTIRKWTEDPAIKTVTFLIGGPYGVPEEIRKKADALWSLSPLTLQGDLAWLVATEQIYRAYTILNGIAYHHD